MVTLSEILAVFERDPRAWCESEIAGQMGVEPSQLRAPLDHLIRMGRLVTQESADVCEICPLHTSCLLIESPERTYQLAPLPADTASTASSRLRTGSFSRLARASFPK